jgi:predicted lipid-binding transport protein (Tim44 family)
MFKNHKDYNKKGERDSSEERRLTKQEGVKEFNKWVAEREKEEERRKVEAARIEKEKIEEDRRRREEEHKIYLQRNLYKKK